ncbi:unnamed protein product [Rhizoctonia solani]|uniref:Peptidase S8/S53 domain-containing protein n=1 Tax=Rhizoctonia solani TaxID=456999 RepID=A0A8H3GEQ8_9AGAM|nr:unnamed protein product [Rhizoctonia solani]
MSSNPTNVAPVSWARANGVRDSYIAVIENQDVDSVHQNEYLKRTSSKPPNVKQSNEQQLVGDTCWGLQRISQKESLSTRDPTKTDFTFHLKPLDNPKLVDVYVIDSGVNVDHHDFGGRAEYLAGCEWGEHATPDDYSGHGTFVAGIIGGTRWEVAKSARIYAIKDHSEDDPNEHALKPEANIIARGISKVIEYAKTTGNPSIINMSLQADGPCDVIDKEVKLALEAKIHIVTGAGNESVEVINQSPAGNKGVLVVAGSDILDRQPYGSSYGKRVDIFAPGFDITSLRNDSLDGTIPGDGSSWAVPHAAGVMAYILAKDGNKETETLISEIKARAVHVIESKDEETTNRLLNTVGLDA